MFTTNPINNSFQQYPIKIVFNNTILRYIYFWALFFYTLTDNHARQKCVHFRFSKLNEATLKNAIFHWVSSDSVNTRWNRTYSSAKMAVWSGSKSLLIELMSCCCRYSCMFRRTDNVSASSISSVRRRPTKNMSMTQWRRFSIIHSHWKWMDKK